MESDKKSLNRVKNKALLYEVGYEYARSVNDDLNSNPDLESIKCTESVDKWFESYCKDLEKEENRIKRNRFFSKYMKKVAIFFGAVILSGAILTVSVEAFRLEVFKMFVNANSNHDEIILLDDVLNEALLPDIENGYYLSYMPEGYVIDDVQSDIRTTTIMYKNYEDKLIFFDYMLFDEQTTIAIDNEDVSEMKVDIDGSVGILHEKEGFVLIIWHKDDLLFKLEGELSIEEALKIGNSIKIIE